MRCRRALVAHLDGGGPRLGSTFLAYSLPHVSLEHPRFTSSIRDVACFVYALPSSTRRQRWVECAPASLRPSRLAPCAARAHPVAASPRARSAPAGRPTTGKPALMLPGARAVGVGAYSAALVRPARRDNVVTERRRACGRGASPQARVSCRAVRFRPSAWPDLSPAWLAFSCPSSLARGRARILQGASRCSLAVVTAPTGVRRTPWQAVPPSSLPAWTRRMRDHVWRSHPVRWVSLTATYRQFGSGSVHRPSSLPDHSAARTSDDSVRETSRTGQHMAIRGAR